ncbi:hypothetical protein Gotur_005063 [Gossypium turneri]
MLDTQTVRDFLHILDDKNIIVAYCLLHNFIRTYMSLDPIEVELGEGLPSNVIYDNKPNIINIHPSDAWATWRMELM